MGAYTRGGAQYRYRTYIRRVVALFRRLQHSKITSQPRPLAAQYRLIVLQLRQLSVKYVVRRGRCTRQFEKIARESGCP